jgi:hypothetical protein
MLSSNYNYSHQEPYHTDRHVQRWVVEDAAQPLHARSPRVSPSDAPQAQRSRISPGQVPPS